MRTYIPENTHLVPADAERVFHGKIFDIYQWQQKMFDGSYATFEMAKRHDTVIIIGIRDDNVVVTRDEQPGRNPRMSFPGGRHDNENETELDAAKREMLEETGITFRNWKLINVFEPAADTNKIEWLMYVFLATDFIDEVEQNLDAGEKIQVQYLDYEEFLKLSSSTAGGYFVWFNKLFKKAGSIEGIKNLPDIKRGDVS